MVRAPRGAPARCRAPPRRSLGTAPDHRTPAAHRPLVISPSAAMKAWSTRTLLPISGSKILWPGGEIAFGLWGLEQYLNRHAATTTPQVHTRMEAYADTSAEVLGVQ